MKGLLRLAGAIDAISRFFGWIAAWLVLLSCLISAGNAASRYLFSLSSNAWLEIQWQMFAGIFLLGAANVLRLQRARPRRPALRLALRTRGKLWIDVFGLVLFLIPAMLTMIFFSWEFFLTELPQRRAFVERRRPAALAGQAPAAARLRLLLLQGVAELIKRIAGLRGDADEIVAYERPLQ